MVITKIQKIELSKIWGWHPPKETTATTKERPNLLVEMNAKSYCGLKQ